MRKNSPVLNTGAPKGQAVNYLGSEPCSVHGSCKFVLGSGRHVKMLVSKIRVYRSDGSDHVASQLPFIVFSACAELQRKREETVLIANFADVERFEKLAMTCALSILVDISASINHLQIEWRIHVPQAGL